MIAMTDFQYDNMLIVAFGERLRAMREFHGMSQRELADAARIGKTTLQGYEVGRHEPGLVSLNKLANALGVSLTSLLGW